MTVEASTTRALDHRLATEQSRQRLPSVVAALVRGGQVVWSGAAGTLDGRSEGAPPTADTQYRIGSISKTFVAVEVVRLRDEGRLDLADTIGTPLPEVPFGHVTIAQLLSHTSGLQAETDGQWWERTPGDDWDTLLASGVSLRFTPGTTFHYSNTGYGVLGELIARLRGVPWHEAVQQGILDPLGMNRTTRRPVEPAAPGLAVHPLADVLHVEPEHDHVSMAPAGQLWSTSDDLARWAAFLGGRTEGVLSSGSLAEMLRPVAVNDVPGVAWTGAHALGWQTWNVDGRRFAGHGGSMPGFLANLRVDVTSGDGVVVMANATSGLGPVARRCRPRRFPRPRRAMVLGHVRVDPGPRGRRRAAPRRARPGSRCEVRARRGRMDRSRRLLPGRAPAGGARHRGRAGAPGARQLRVHPHAVRRPRRGARRHRRPRLALSPSPSPDLRTSAPIWTPDPVQDSADLDWWDRARAQSGRPRARAASSTVSHFSRAPPRRSG